MGGSPQGSWMGQMAYIAASDDAARGLEDQDKYKYCDDLTILELIALGGMLSDYNFREHVASDIAVDELYINPENLQTQENLYELQNWTNLNLMKLNEKKTNYILFNRVRTPFSTRLTINGQWLERKQSIKLLGVWLQEDGGWGKNTQELCRKAYLRLGMLTKLRYAGVPTEDLITIYKLHIRSCLEYNAVSFHSSLTSQQAAALERCQSVCLKVILQDNFVSYEAAMEMAGLKSLAERRIKRCLDFSKKCLKHPINKRMFPLNPNLGNQQIIRAREKYLVNFAYTNTYKNSTIPSCQRLLNSEEKLAQEEEQEEQGQGVEGEEEDDDDEEEEDDDDEEEDDNGVDRTDTSGGDEDAHCSG